MTTAMLYWLGSQHALLLDLGVGIRLPVAGHTQFKSLKLAFEAALRISPRPPAPASFPIALPPPHTNEQRLALLQQ